MWQRVVQCECALLIHPTPAGHGRRICAATLTAVAAIACASEDRSSREGWPEDHLLTERLERHETAGVETLDELDRRLAACAPSPCPHLVYVWSSSMPLSVSAMDEIARAAESLHVPLSMVRSAAVPGLCPRGAVGGGVGGLP